MNFVDSFFFYMQHWQFIFYPAFFFFIFGSFVNAKTVTEGKTILKCWFPKWLGVKQYSTVTTTGDSV